MADIQPVICPCRCSCDFLSKLDKNVYDVESTNTFLYDFFDIVCMEFCDVQYSKQKAKNDFYLWTDHVEEPVIKGESHGIDCLRNKTVVEIISVGDLPGASDYEEGIDYQINECGIEWIESSRYYAYYNGQGSSSGRDSKEPQTGYTYYVTYRSGVRNSKLYDVFGVLVGLIKQDYQTYPNYRKAIRSLIEAFLLGPTVESMLSALSIFTDRSNIEIVEGFQAGWVLGESFLYTKDAYDDATQNTQDGTILSAEGEDFIFDINVYNSETVEDKDLFVQIANKIKPAHTIVFVHFY